MSKPWTRNSFETRTTLGCLGAPLGHFCSLFLFHNQLGSDFNELLRAWSFCYCYWGYFSFPRGGNLAWYYNTEQRKHFTPTTNPPREGLDAGSKVGVRCVKEVIVLSMGEHNR